jgi:hypothetical protein
MRGESIVSNVKEDKQSSAAPKQGGREYYQLEPSFAIRSSFHRWVNQAEQLKGFAPASSKPFGGIEFTEPPQIRFTRRGRPSALADAEPVTLGIWLVSDRLKEIFERLDPEAFVFQSVIVDYSNLSHPGPDLWFCYFMRELDCVDEARSEIVYQKNIAWKNYIHLIEVIMRPEAVASAHAFRLKYATLKLIVDDVIVDALRAENIRGVEFVATRKN